VLAAVAASALIAPRRKAMKKMTTKKLHLAKDTLRGMQDEQLRHLAGGALTGVSTCVLTILNQCHS
jgi:hypothetical protein